MNGMRLSLAAFALAGLAAACSEQPTGPLDHDFEPAASVSGGVYVLNTQLRGIINPAIQPTPAWGHVQIKLVDDGVEGFRVEWKGKLFNPAGETFATAYILDLEGNPAPEPDENGMITGGLVFQFFRGATQSCDILNFDSQGITDEEHIPFEAAMNMIIDPEHFGVLMVSTGGTAVWGNFGLPDPTEVFGFNPQPDPPREKVRCAAVGATP